ncbi:glycoside hydrolase family 20 protein [Bacteroides sedimenti]|uniref:beta-N-acetylhexosaminidase n=1 Tax=Bacteroides sedimenti TaxID=2136147 RepID=A0ABM8IBL4_9BACE
MKQNRIHILILLLALLCGSREVAAQLNITPKPQFTELQKGAFTLDKKTVLYTNLKGEEKGNMLSLLQESPLKLSSAKKVNKKNSINLLLVNDSTSYSSPESYQLLVTPKQITISAKNGAGLFYGVQSLLQLINQNEGSSIKSIPALQIKDEPRLTYRGLHLDVSRHFFTKEFIKKQLDMMAYYKLNRFHWHLTDGAGWRIEIKKYPLLTDVTAWRPYNTWKEWWKNGRKYCTKDNPKAQGGFYTQEDIKDVVAYAQKRYITVIPEIEMPGHSEEVLAVYPQLSCSGKPYVNSDFCIGNDSTFTFLQDVLTEVMDLFPSKYIHIGGDEAGKSGWKTCPKCQARMQNENLKDVDHLQSYLIHRIENFLNAHGRKLLGWDEILQGGLAPDATVMSWRGEEGGIASAKAGHQAIMTPGAYCYFDAYQDAPNSEPEAIGGFLPLQKVYSYNPVPDSLTAEQKKLIMGVQANLWTEYVPTPEHAEYMIYPRLLALAEVGWTAPENKSYPEFRQRALKAVDFLESRGYHPFQLKNEVGERPASLVKENHLAVGKKITYKEPYYPGYTAGGDSALVNGWRGGWTYGDRRWQGIINHNLDVVIDLGATMPVKSISATFMQLIGPGVWMPHDVEIKVSEDGVNFTTLKQIANEVPEDYERLALRDFGWEGSTTARYVEYIARPNSKKGFLFVDEIIVK